MASNDGRRDLRRHLGDGRHRPAGHWVGADGAAPAGNALAGLDALDLAGRPGGGRGRFAVRLWNTLWPKVLAIALVLGVWELITLSGYKKHIWPATGPTLVNLWDQAKTGTLWKAIGEHAGERGDRLRGRDRGRRRLSARWSPGSPCSGRRSAR